MTLELFGLRSRTLKRNVLEAAYVDEGFSGCYTPDSGGLEGAAAVRAAESFRDAVGINAARWSLIHDSLQSGEDTETGYIASRDAFLAWERDGQGPDWLFSIQQNSGICVDASNVEMKCGLLAARAMNPAIGEVMRYLPAFYAYAERRSCGQGWYMGACAEVNYRVGWCPAMQIDVDGHRLDFDEEDDSEYIVTRTWCRSGIPDWLKGYTAEAYPFDPGAITEFDGAIDALKQLFRSKGQLHHGSNYTSASGTPGRLRRIGGHAQTAFGMMWDDATIRHFRDAGIDWAAEANPPVAHHQTWGSGWSGEVDDRYWPPHWGPKPEGAWICSAEQTIRTFVGAGRSYAYLPLLAGVPGESPPPPADAWPVSLQGRIYTDSGDAIRGKPEVVMDDGTRWPFIVVPSDRPNQYEFTRRHL